MDNVSTNVGIFYHINVSLSNSTYPMMDEREIRGALLCNPAVLKKIKYRSNKMKALVYYSVQPNP